MHFGISLSCAPWLARGGWQRKEVVFLVVCLFFFRGGDGYADLGDSTGMLCLCLGRWAVLGLPRGQLSSGGHVLPRVLEISVEECCVGLLS